MPHDPPKLVIFDCDGVLVDSEAIANEVGAEWITSLGWTMDAHEARSRFLGLSDAAMFRQIEDRIGRVITDAEIAHKRAKLRARFAAELQAVLGVERVVRALWSRGIALAVASSGERDKILTNLTQIGLRDFFGDQISSATEVVEAKPAPDVYLLAAKKAGVAPCDCLAIEDSPNGVLAAVRAGMHVIGFAGETPTADLVAAGAHKVYTTMDDIGAYLEQVV